MKSLKKVLFSRFWKKKGKISYLTDEELNELIKSLETGQFSQGLSLIRKINRRRNLDIDSTAITFALEDYILFCKGEVEEGGDDRLLLADELNKLLKQVKTLRGKIVVKIRYTMVCMYIKHDDNYLESFNELLEIIDKSQNAIDPLLRDWFLMKINVSLGTIYLNNGEYDSALNYLSESSSLNDKHNWKTGQAEVLLIIGLIYFFQDEVLAIEKYQESLKIAKEIGYTRAILVNEFNLVDCFYEKGDFQKALKLAKILHKKAHEAKITHSIGVSLSIIIRSLLELNLDDQIQPYLDELEELATTFPQNHIINYDYQYAKALVLKSSNLFTDRIQAQELFTKLMTETPGIRIDPKIGFHITELTLKELQTTNNESLLVEFEQTLDLMREKALQFKSPSMVVETYLLESKLALIQTNLKESQQKLDQALKLAREKNLHRMLFKVSKAYDKFLDEKKIWESLITKEAPLKERLNKAKLDQLIDQAIHRRLETIEEVPEESVYLFIICDSGLTVYSYDFQEEQVIDDQLVGGFLSAINTFCQEMFSTKGGYLERVKYQDYTILLEPIGESFICSYVIRGQSYLASKRLIKLIDEIKSSHLYADFEDIKTTGLVKLDYAKMKDMIIEIF